MELLFASGNVRYERKFVIHNIDWASADLIVRKNGAIFRQKYPERWVNSIYFDSPSMAFYNVHVNGAHGIRLKIRIRWYGVPFDIIENPVLECKMKKGIVSSKVRYALPSFNASEVSSEKLTSLLQQSKDVPCKLKELFPFLKTTVVIRYQRKYYESSDKHFMVTLDTHIQARRPEIPFFTKVDFIDGEQFVVLELKYPESYDNDAGTVSNQFGFTLSKYSKYISAIERLYAV